MEVLREHKDSVMAVLEAFVYDPLLNWRLMDSEYQRVLRALKLGLYDVTFEPETYH